jgi:uncharacterized tellurite resistance protein B-like protein
MNNELFSFSSSFKNELTNQQKRAILGAMIVTAEADYKMNSKEEKFIELIIDLLGVDLTDDYFNVPAGVSEVADMLNSLSQQKKEWLLFALHTLILIDGNISSDETTFIIGIAQDMKINEFELVDIIKKFERKSLNH